MKNRRNIALVVLTTIITLLLLTMFAFVTAEVGELLGLYQKMYQGHELIEEHEQKEIGDILWMVAEYCTTQGWELDDIMALNIEKLKARFPDGFDPEKSLHRKEGDI